VFGLAFVKLDGVTDSFTEAEVRAFVLPKLNTESAIVQLDNTSSGENYHSGRGDEIFTGILTKVFVTSDLAAVTTTTTNVADLTAAGVNVYFLTVDGINETAVKSVYSDNTPRWWRIEFMINNPVYGYSRILELGLRDEKTLSLPSTGSTISPVIRTSNLKDIYVWTRLPTTNIYTWSSTSQTTLYEQIKIQDLAALSTAQLPGIGYASVSSIFDGSTTTTQWNSWGYDATSSSDSSAHVRFDYEFHEPTDALEIVFTDGNQVGYMGGITNMSIYSSVTGGKNDSEWNLHSTFVNYQNPVVAADPNTDAGTGWDETYTPKGLKIIQYNTVTKQWEFKGIFEIS